jgi:hypothetical protein
MQLFFVLSGERLVFSYGGQADIDFLYDLSAYTSGGGSQDKQRTPKKNPSYPGRCST